MDFKVSIGAVDKSLITASKHAKVNAQLSELNLQEREDIIVIDALSDTAPTGSRA